MKESDYSNPVENYQRASIGDEIMSIQSNDEIIAGHKDQLSRLSELWRSGAISFEQYEFRTDAISIKIDDAQRLKKTSEENVDHDMTGKPFTVAQLLGRFIRRNL